MNKYLLKLNDKLNKCSYDELYIEDLFYIDSEFNDEILCLFNRFKNLDFKQFSLCNEELELVFIELEVDYHKLIILFLNYLVLFSSQPNKSNFYHCCLEFINEYFLNIKSICNGLPNYNLFKILDWLWVKLPCYKNEITRLLYLKIIEGDVNITQYLSLVNGIINNKKISNIFNIDSYFNIYSKFLISKCNQENINFYLRSYSLFYNYSLNYKHIKKIIGSKYCDFVLENINLIDDHTKQVLLRNIRQIMDSLKIYSDEKYALLDEHLEKANKNILSTLKEIVVPLPEKYIFLLEEKRNKIDLEFKKLPFKSQLDKLFMEIYPIKIEQIKQSLLIQEDSLLSLVKENILDSNGFVINFKELNEQENFSLKANYCISFNLSVLFDVLINPFLANFKFNDNLYDYIKSILFNNKLVPNDRVDTLTESFVTFLNKDFKHSVTDIIFEFEASLRYYFKSLKFNIYKKDGSNDFISLSTMLNYRNNNNYRENLLKIIDEDYYFILTWFLVDEYGFNLRNKIGHRYSSANLSESLYAIYITFMIFRLYWWFSFNK